MVELISERIIELGIDLGLECLSSAVNDKAFNHEYKKVVEEIFDIYRDKFKLSSMDEEYDYQGLCYCLRTPSMINHVKVAISGTQSERKQARARIYQEAYCFANAQTAESRKQVRKIVGSILETLRDLERKKVPLETRVINAAAVEEINNHSDDNTKMLCETINNLGDIIKASEKKTSLKQYDSMYNALLDTGGEIYEKGCIRFNINSINREILSYADEEERFNHKFYVMARS